MKKGFTLIEILIGIALLAILVAIVVAAINPAKRFQEARDTQRWSDVTAILDAVYLNMLGNTTAPGTFDFSGCTATAFPTSSGTDIKTAPGTDLCTCLVDSYMGLMPTDPQSGHGGKGLTATECSAYDTDYQIWQPSSGMPIYVDAPSVEGGGTIRVTR